MSVYGTDTSSSKFRSFSRQRSHSGFSEDRSPDTLHLSGYVCHGFADDTPYGLRPTRSAVGPPGFLRPSITQTRWYRIINLLSIDYAFRPRLRIRLTPGGRTFPGKPWVFGDRNSHPVFRYSCLHGHLYAVHRGLHPDFNPHTTLFYHRNKLRSAASVLNFSPDHLRRDITRPVSCYALFK